MKESGAINFEKLLEEESRARQMAKENELTDNDYKELARVQKRFEDVGDIRLSLLRDRAARWANRWDMARNVSLLLAVGGEVANLVGQWQGLYGLSTVGDVVRDVGIGGTAMSIFTGGYARFEERDAIIELAVRGDIRR